MPENIDTTTSPMPGGTAPERPAARRGAGLAEGEPPSERPVAAAGGPRRFARRGSPSGREPLPAEGRGVAADEPGAAARERRRGVWRRRRSPAAAAVGTIGAGILAVARLVMAVAALIALLIVLAIVLRDVDANGSNTIIKGIHEGANFFAGAFSGLIRFNGHYKRAITVNWGIAAIVYLLVGWLISSMIGRVGRGGIRFERRRSAAPIH